MHNKQLFEYAIIRIVPRVEREEFVNAGVILYSRAFRFLQMRYQCSGDKIKCLYASTDMEMIKENMLSFEAICTGTDSKSPIAALDAAQRFRWLAAKRSTVIQTSQVHPGFTDDPLLTLEKLMQQYVLE